jgi:hypothetical protein
MDGFLIIYSLLALVGLGFLVVALHHNHKEKHGK